MTLVEPTLESQCPGDLGLQFEASLTGRAEIDRLPEPALGPGGIMEVPPISYGLTPGTWPR